MTTSPTKPSAGPRRRARSTITRLLSTLLFGSILALFAAAQAASGHETGAQAQDAGGHRIGPAGVRLISESLYVAEPPPGKPVPQRQPDIDQARLLAGEYPLYQVLEAGQNLFNNPFRPKKGHGEGRHGPRSLQRAYWNPRGATLEQDAWPFLRVNGIDSQSCFECHNTIGEARPDGARTPALVRKPGAQGGPAGAANSAFINDQFPEHSGQPNSVMTKFVRNPPPVFGTGYTQRLATEMSVELMARAEAARIAARRMPGQVQRIALTSKDVDFGSFAVTCSSADPASCTDDTSQVSGVQADLIVRPFQWGGIASSVRHFARDALDFHFSVQAVEKVGSKDCDLDGLSDEVTVGNVSALTSYVAMFRPPGQIIEPGKESSVQRGRELLDKIGCTDCHRASMPVENATLTVMTPPAVPADAPCPEEVSSLINPVAMDNHHIHRAAQVHLRAATGQPDLNALDDDASPDAIYQALADDLHDAGVAALGGDNYQIDLSLHGVSGKDAPAYVWPRLPASENNGVEVPLFSDLKLHFMGKQLADDFAQPTDVEGYSAQPGHYVTRVLWGIRDSDPYLHDGRARTLTEAIELHGVDGSEAKPAADGFAALSPHDRQALIDFLESLRLPIAEGVAQPEYVSR